MHRRRFLQTLTLAAWAPAGYAAKTDLSGFRGVFPIMQTPYSDAGAVDLETLAKQTGWLGRTGCHGIVWPQLASEYAHLSFDERIAGMSAIVEANRGLKPKCVLGVQAEDVDTAVRYAKHADKIRPDAIIAIPPRKGDQREFDLETMRAYYKAIGKATDLPLFMQAIGDVSVEFILGLMREVPTLRFVKDEAGHTLYRISEFAQVEASRRPALFTGGHGKTLIDEMARGSAGNMPAASIVDLYADCWDLWHEGRRGEAIDVFSKIMLFVTQFGAYGLESLSYVLHLRGVFPNWKVRSPRQNPMDAQAMEALERSYEFVKPYLRA
ncbi:MAG: dihydrodipicolinate synthase family protein [Bryobacterales bacterium]|nr:dihydrodipicolinate synthase family protein [Bryobacterales bacterium]